MVVEELEIHEAFVAQLLEPGHAFLDRTWWELFPKKLKVGYRHRAADDSHIGMDDHTDGAWCVHIIEGLNTFAVVWVCLMIFVLSASWALYPRLP